MKNIIVVVLALFLTIGQAIADEPFESLRSRQLPGFKVDIPRDSIQLSDPCILADRATGLYYMTGTRGKLWISRNLNEWTGPYSLIEPDPESWMGNNPEIWAAELHPYKGKYYCFATFTNNKKLTGKFRGMDLPRRASHVMVSDVPWGPYRPVSNQNYLPEDRPTLDGTFWVDSDGKPYMVYCGEWISNWDGTMESIQLKDDLSGSVGIGKLLFKASSSPWSREKLDGKIVPNRVTDGPWLFRTGTGRLGMIWTSWIYDVYTQGVAYSESGTLDGPWIQEEEPITPPNYGHGMLFKDLQGRWLMSVHSHRNDNGHYIRIPQIFEVDLSGDKLKIGKKLSMATGTVSQTPLYNGGEWYDTDGNRINCHGGNIIKTDSLYYWYGEHRPGFDVNYQKGVACYSSPDLVNWKNEGIVLATVNDTTSVMQKGCTIERPKVVYCPKTGKYMMWFHHELKGRGYEAAHVGVAESKSPIGPFRFLRSQRVNPGKYPLNFDKKFKGHKWTAENGDWWTPEWLQAVKEGMFTERDRKGGQMSRDMTIFVDEDGKAYHIYSSEENATLQIAELTDDYARHTGKYVRIFPTGQNEAPVIFKKDGKYWMICSGCTGWAPNKARMFSADDIMGEWTEHPSPFVGEGSDKTFDSQGAFPLIVDGNVNFFADEWHPRNLADSRYKCYPVEFDSNSVPVIKNVRIAPVLNKTSDGKKLVWSDEFDNDGPLDSIYWNFEKGFVRNHEDQWYQADNAYCKDGLLVLEARKENRINPLYQEGDTDWRSSRPTIKYSSASVNTRGKQEFQYGTLEVRARIPVASGAWPAIWTLGKEMPWPSNGEIDVMEYYRINGVPHILANAAWGKDKPYDAEWNSKTVPFEKFLAKDPDWASKFHIWRMDWDKDFLRIYLDDELINEISLEDTYNGKVGNGANPMRQPHYVLLDLALGGDHGGPIANDALPMKYEIDYVRIYQ